MVLRVVVVNAVVATDVHHGVVSWHALGVVVVVTNSGVHGVAETPLHLVAVTGNADIASKLLEREVNVNARNNQDATPLWLAAGKGHYDVVRLLLQHPYIHVDCPRRDALIET